jgi:hypothetical protein
VLIRVKEKGKWRHVTPREFGHSSLEEFFAKCDGKKYAAKIALPEEDLYLCGTKEIMQATAKKYPGAHIVVFPAGITLLRKTHPHLLEYRLYDELHTAFPDAQVLAVRYPSATDTVIVGQTIPLVCTGS